MQQGGIQSSAIFNSKPNPSGDRSWPGSKSGKGIVMITAMYLARREKSPFDPLTRILDCDDTAILVRFSSSLIGRRWASWRSICPAGFEQLIAPVCFLSNSSTESQSQDKYGQSGFLVRQELRFQAVQYKDLGKLVET